MDVYNWLWISLDLRNPPACTTVLDILKNYERIEMKSISVHATMRNSFYERSIDINNIMVEWV